MNTESHERNIVKGSVLMIFCFFFVSVFGLLLKFGSKQGLSPFLNCFILYLSGLIIQSCLIYKKGISFLKTKRPVGHFFRGFIGALATIFYILAMKTIALMNATLLFNSTPLFIPIIALLFLRAKISLKVWISIVIGFVGVVLILHPRGDLFQWGDLYGLLSGIALAIAFIFIQLLSK